MTAFSEAMYWYAGGTGYPERVLFYLMPATALLWCISSYPSARWSAVVLVGAIYGFVVEGVLTPVVYGGFPFDPFAISYPSLGWHALVAVVGGLVFLHRLLTRGSVARVVASLALFGVFWGTWAMTQRLPPGPGDELSGVAAFVGRVDVPAFALYALAVTSVVGLCHLLLGRVVRPADLVPGRRWSLAMLVAGALWFAVLVVPAAPWAPVELGALVWTCRWCLRRLSRGSDGRTIGTDICEPIRLARLGLLPLVPAAATATYALLIHVLPNEQTLRAYVLDPIVLVQMIAGWTIVLWAVWSARRRAWPAARLSRGFRVLP